METRIAGLRWQHQRPAVFRHGVLRWALARAGWSGDLGPPARRRPIQAAEPPLTESFMLRSSSPAVPTVGHERARLCRGERARLRVCDIDFGRRVDVRRAFSDVGGHVVLGTPKSHQSRTVPARCSRAGGPPRLSPPLTLAPAPAPTRCRRLSVSTQIGGCRGQSARRTISGMFQVHLVCRHGESDRVPLEY